MQCQVLLAVIARTRGEAHTMLARSTEALTTATRHGWPDSTWSITATSLLAHAALLRADPPQAQRLAAEGLTAPPALLTPPLRFALQAIHGAATFDQGHRANGLAELQQARSELGERPIGAEQAASAAVLEFHAALQLGHSTAARTVYNWLTERTHHNAELLVMRAWTESAGGHHDHARTLLRPVLDATTPALLPHTQVDAWLLETTLAMAADERPTARRALQTALALAEPLEALRPFTHAGPGVRELLVHQLGSFGTTETFAQHALAAGTPSRKPTHHPQRTRTHRPRTPPLHALPRRNRHRPHRLGQHRQKPRPIHLHQTRRQQPPHRCPLRPRNRPTHHQTRLTTAILPPTPRRVSMQDRVNDPAARRRVLDALCAVLSDDHNYELGLATLRDLMDHTVRQDGATALSDLTVALSLELAQALHRIARDEGLATADVAEIWFAD